MSFTNGFYKLIITCHQLYPIFLCLLNNMKSFLFIENFLIICYCIGLFTIIYFNYFKPLLYWFYFKWIDVIHWVYLYTMQNTFVFVHYYSSITSNFQSISPWSIKQNPPRTLPLKTWPGFIFFWLRSHISIGSSSPCQINIIFTIRPY